MKISIQEFHNEISNSRRLTETGMLKSEINSGNPLKPTSQTYIARNKHFSGPITLILEVRPQAKARDFLVVSHADRYILCSITPSGNLLTDVRVEKVSFLPIDNGFFRLEVSWNNSSNIIAFGLGQKRRAVETVFIGTGENQWEIRSVFCEKMTDYFSENITDVSEILTLVDVGAFGGLNPKWDRWRLKIRPVLFEALEEEAELIQSQITKTYPHALVIPKALSDADGKSTLYVTKAPSCSSLRMPNSEVVSRYPIAGKFTVVKEVSVLTNRYESLYAEGIVPIPDVIKLDVQGMEYEILAGFGNLLNHVVAIETEAHFAEVYQGQKLLSDISAYLDKFGFALKAMRPNHPAGWNRELTEVNAFFLKREQNLESIPYGSAKLRIAAEAMDAWE